MGRILNGGLEGAVAVPEKNTHYIGELTSEGEVGFAVRIKITGGHIGSLARDRDGRRLEAAVAVANDDRETVFLDGEILHRHGQVKLAVVIQIRRHEPVGFMIEGIRNGRRKTAIAVAEEDGDATGGPFFRAVNRDRQVELALAIKVGDFNSNRIIT